MITVLSVFSHENNTRYMLCLPFCYLLLLVLQTFMEFFKVYFYCLLLISRSYMNFITKIFFLIIAQFFSVLICSAKIVYLYTIFIAIMTVIHS